jgi:hypothetical protein
MFVATLLRECTVYGIHAGTLCSRRFYAEHSLDELAQQIGTQPDGLHVKITEVIQCEKREHIWKHDCRRPADVFALVVLFDIRVRPGSETQGAPLLTNVQQPNALEHDSVSDDG